MIPKKIHYCWFGKKDKPERVLNCINSWEKYLTDYEIIEWNENNFDINSNIFTKQAYENNMYAFVSDYVRLYILYNYGGIYFDTDVELLKNMDNLLNLEGFIGFETNIWISTAVIGSEANNEIIKSFLESYNNKTFVKDNTIDLTPNPQVLTPILKELYNLKLNGKKQRLYQSDFYVYPVDWFCANTFPERKIKITKNTYTIHYFNASWHKK